MEESDVYHEVGSMMMFEKGEFDHGIDDNVEMRNFDHTIDLMQQLSYAN